MIVRHNFIFTLLALGGLALSQAHFPQYCAECEQEIWEQVPCSELSTTTQRPPSTTTDSSLPITTTTPRSTTSTTTRRSTMPPTLPPIYTTPQTPYVGNPAIYKKCYWDYAPGGQVEFTHSHQRKYYPKYAAPNRNYKPYPLAYNEASAPTSTNINAPNYTLEELAHLLSNAYGTKKGYPASLPPTQQSVYYSPQVPLVARLQPEYKQMMSKVAGAEHKERVIIKTASAAISTSGGGVAIAKAKTPYSEVVVTSAPIYESTTSYPVAPPELPKSYAQPEPEPLPLPPMPQTEAYPTQTESYPDKSYESPESNSIKPQSPPPSSSSSFDLAIDNYLKDFGYGNHVRDLDY
ncbi:extensin isoform X2 [Drosophila grimshawi]|uniref:extensin isoform X2 n=1 Tax=Drosophila grimshawi TaxID=7222 RepID=UPI000C86FDB5|nr:extensin isoform X2 [Drosophila grimshawi]